MTGRKGKMGIAVGEKKVVKYCVSVFFLFLL